jgi:DNA-binding response OmpR family regulator
MRTPFRFDELLARVQARLRATEQLDELRRELGRAEG